VTVDGLTAGSAPATLTVVVPCYNEEAVLPETAVRLDALLAGFVAAGLVASDSRVLFVDDGSRDRTWTLIEELAGRSTRFAGLKLSRNRGHQNALLAGLLTARGGILISVDADLQDDLGAIADMLAAHRAGADIVFGVRRGRDVDTAFKRLTAEGYYRLLDTLGVEVVFNHADYRLMSRRAIEALRDFGEVNLFLRGVIPQLGFTTAIVSYDRQERFAGESKYPLRKMLALAAEGVTSFSTRPLRWITFSGLLVSALSFLVGLWALGTWLFGAETAPGWTSTVVPMVFIAGLQLLSLGIIGEYVGKIYLETKGRPRFIIEKTVNLLRPDPAGAALLHYDDP
jgi:polyisoprenyl-phosphate glycosyltransferase